MFMRGVGFARSGLAGAGAAAEAERALLQAVDRDRQDDHHALE